MDLDDLQLFKQLDPQNLLAEIDNLPDQFASAFALGGTLPLPEWRNIRHVLIAGMGSSAIGAELLAAYLAPTAPVPVTVHRGYSLPAWARGENVLVVASSHSGNTEETLDAFESARLNGCRLLALTTGGELAKRAAENGIPLWRFTHQAPPHTALGFSYGLLLALFSRLELIPSQTESVAGAVEAMKKSQTHLHAEVPAAHNPAKRYAGQLVNRWVTILGAGLLEPVARYLKGQVNLVAKAGANFEPLPEANHTAMAGLSNPEVVLMPKTMTLFLRAPSDHRRNRQRTDLTKQGFMLEGLNTDFIDARGPSPLAHQWTLILFGDYMAYYLAMAYHVNPGSEATLENFSKMLKEM